MSSKSFLQCLSVGVFALCFGSISAQSQNVYCVGPTATGNGSGADWSDLKAWSSTPARGDTWYLVGGSYASKTFSTPVSGSTYITITKATVADHAGISTGWTDAMGTSQAVFAPLIYFGSSYWIFDGATGSMTTNPAAYGFAIASPNTGGFVLGSNTGQTITDITIAHTYSLGQTADVGSYMILCYPVNATARITISSNFWDNYTAHVMANTQTANSNPNWIIQGNVFGRGFASSSNHGEMIDCNYGGMQNPIIRYNLFLGHSSNPNATGQTGVICANNSDMTGAQIYGNVFDSTRSANGIITGTSAGRLSNAQVYNNTFLNAYPNSGAWLTGGQSGGTGNVAYNNLFYNMDAALGSGSTSDYGAYFSCTSTPSEAHKQTGSGNPFNNSAGQDYTLNANTQPGIDLGAPYNVDALGKTRTTWTRGAFEYGSGTLSTNPVISVSSLSLNFGSVLTNTTAYLTNTVQNSGGGILIGAATISLPLLSPFNILSGGTYALGANQSTNLVVSFSPGAVGSFTNSILLTALGGSGLTETLSGNGVAGYSAPQVTAVSQSGSDVDAGSSGLQVYAGYNETYSGSASDPSGLSLTWQWIYTVNGGAETVLQSGSGTVTAVSYNYPASAAGKTYVWKLRVNNGYSTSESDLTVAVEAPPVVTSSLTFQPSAGNMSSPFVLSGNYVSQPATTGTNGGQLVYFFQTTSSSVFAVEAQVDAPSVGANSFYVNIDVPPTDPTNIWDIPVTAGFANVIVTWRGNGTNDQIGIYPQQNFSLSAGTHQLIIKGREGGAELGPITIVKLQPPPPTPVVVTP